MKRDLDREGERDKERYWLIERYKKIEIYWDIDWCKEKDVDIEIKREIGIDKDIDIGR